MSDITDRLQEVARTVESILPPGTGFILLAFDFNTDQGRLEYVANARREDVVNVMKEFIARSKGNFGKHLDTEPKPPG